MRQKLNLITLGVNDLERSTAFYEKSLGWKKSPASVEGLALFPLGGITLALHAREELAEDAMTDPGGTGFSGITLSHNAKSEQEVNEVFRHLEEMGAAIAKSPQKASWGGYSGYFKDPDGHLIEVAYNPFWKLDEQDNLVL